MTNNLNPTFFGVKAIFSCSDWEQVELIGNLWESATKHIPWSDLVGLGFNWTPDGQYFDYALGTISADEKIYKLLRSLDFSALGLRVEPCKIDLPQLNDWKTFCGQVEEIQTIYEEIDRQYKYDYELERLDGLGNFSVTIHPISSIRDY